MHLLAFLWASLFVSPRMVIAINLLLDFSSSFLLCGKGVTTTTRCQCNKCLRYVQHSNLIFLSRTPDFGA